MATPHCCRKLDHLPGVDKSSLTTLVISFEVFQNGWQLEQTTPRHPWHVTMRAVTSRPGDQWRCSGHAFAPKLNWRQFTFPQMLYTLDIWVDLLLWVYATKWLVVPRRKSAIMRKWRCWNRLECEQSGYATKRMAIPRIKSKNSQKRGCWNRSESES